MSTQTHPITTAIAPTEREAIIRVEGLTKKFGDFTAVDHIDFEVYRGELFGFLGPNGAGKTTTISMLVTLSEPTEGHATVAGHDVAREQDAVRHAIGIVFQEPSLDENLTARENLEFHAVLYNMSKAEREKRIPEVLEMVQLVDRADDLVERFSGGMKRRLEIARGLLHTPKVLFLDEPTIGLDPQTRRHIWDYIDALRQREDITIFLTTHYMDEAEFADRIAIMDHGKIVALDTPDGLKRQVGGDVITVRTPDMERDADRIEQQFGVKVQRYKDELRFEVENGETFIPRFVREFPGTITAISLRRPTLDDVFLKLTGRTIRDAELDAEDITRNRMRRRMRMRRH
nr:ATP-binding cassette domain-containing protein [Ardenticatena sp.]